MDRRRLRRPLFWGASLLVLSGCAVEEWRNADLQLDIASALPSTAEQVRVCVDGAGVRDHGAATVGRFAVPGVPTVRPAVVTVQVLIAGSEDTGATGDASFVIGQAGPATLESDAAYTKATYTEYTAGEGPSLCDVTGSFAGDEEESWLLAVRFTD